MLIIQKDFHMPVMHEDFNYLYAFFDCLIPLQMTRERNSSRGI